MDAGRTLDQDTDTQTVVLRCGAVPVPDGLSALRRVDIPARPGRDVVDPLLDGPRRVIVVGFDADLAAVLTRLMRVERLDIELGYVTGRASRAARVWSLPTGDQAAALAVGGAARSVALARDDAGVALVGRATLVGPAGARLTGETYADSTLLFSGTTRGVLIEPTDSGLRAAVSRRFPHWVPGRWVPGRAVQTGSTGLLLTRDEVAHERVVARSTFYRHTTDWLLVR